MLKKLIFSLMMAGFSSVIYSQSQTIKILSWNIFMIPPTIYKSCQAERAPLICDMVKKLDADIIVFQEAFQRKIRAIIWDGLKSVYPYESGITKSGFLRTHSGVWILSKYPIERKEHIVYKRAKGSDMLAKKGATFVEVNINGKKVQVIGTHVQSGAKFQKIRNLQYKQLMDELASKYFDANIPQLIVGDLNTDYFVTKDYKDMISILDVEDVKHTGEPFSNYGSNNDIGKKFFGSHNETLDYILLRTANEKIAEMKSEIIHSSKLGQPFCKAGFTCLSDHSPVMAEIGIY